jgi:methylphosphotriester-DNA--protein-cysteine methyltransferase
VERCPICRATLNGAETCRRCRAELRQAQGIEQLASALVGAAMLAIVQGHKDETRRLLARARLLHATPVVQALWRLTTLGSMRQVSRSTSEARAPELARLSSRSPDKETPLDLSA